MTVERDLTKSPPKPTDPAILSPLGPFAGAKPPAPAWFDKAIAREPERRFVEVEGARIETLIWGDEGKPGLLLMHGNGAHADWYSFIAPFFADHYRVAAISWSGMGRSDWRERYSLDLFSREALVAAEDAGLFLSAEKPIFVAHSFGGDVGIWLAANSGERLKGMILLDNVPRPPEMRWKGPPNSDGRPARVHPSLEAALARFRLMPPQGCENLYIVDHIARHSLKPAPADLGPEGSLVWRFDPMIWPKMDQIHQFEPEKALEVATCPVAFIWGEHSQLIPKASLDFTRMFIPKGTPMIAVPDADHHLMLDQPLATIAALRAVLATWPPETLG